MQIGGWRCPQQPVTRHARLSFIGFTAARILHSIFYLLQMQLWRTIVWGIGHALLLFMVLSTFPALR